MLKKSEKGLVTHLRPDSIVTEQYRAVRTHLEFSTMEQNFSTLLITSPDTGDGKSTTTSNLAASLAQQGRKVLVVDADLRKPSIHRTFKLVNTLGLTDVLLGKSTVKEAIKQTAIPRLEVLPSGSIPLNPAELLGTSAMKELIETLKEQYDSILIDAAPVLDVVDARILAHFCSGVILVLCKGKTKRQDAAEAIRVLEFVKANVVGVILNQKS